MSAARKERPYKMKDGFIKVAAATPKIKVADCEYNTKQIISIMKEAGENGVKLLVLPELCITGYTCGDLFLQDTLIKNSEKALLNIAAASEEMLTVVGVPLIFGGKLYDCAAVVFNKKILGIIPKTYIPNYTEFYEKRHFSVPSKENRLIKIGDNEVLFGTKLLFCCENMKNFTLSVEICEDLWSYSPPSGEHCAAGATVIANTSASDEIVGKADYRRSLVANQCARLLCGYIYADAGEGESSTDLVFAAHNMVAENGVILNEKKFTNELTISELDVDKCAFERRRMTSFPSILDDGYAHINFSLTKTQTSLTRFIAKQPFVPSDEAIRSKRCEEILLIQALGLKKRLEHSNASTAVVGISGGLDSTLALLVTVRAMDMLGRPRTNIITVTMPCFGTTNRTKDNATTLCERLGTTLKIIDISASVKMHLKDIMHDIKNQNVVYENAQARERTQVLMDIANQMGGLVIGTGDLSEMALGWSTYNGDHMSMYGVNCSVPKTLVRYLVSYVASKSEDALLQKILIDILDTPVSPELLPAKNGEISQKTEDLVGPYELHDFFLYYAIRWGFSPAKVYKLAQYAFEDVSEYDDKTILKWLKIFYHRFFAQQFKRSCIPDGPKVGTVALSPRGDWRMPSDASDALWQSELNEL